MLIAQGSITQQQVDYIMEELGTKYKSEIEATPGAFLELHRMLKETNVNLGEDFETFMQNLNKTLVTGEPIIVPIEKIIENFFINYKTYLIIAVIVENFKEGPRCMLNVSYDGDTKC